MSAIADEAGVQRATVYRHFPDDEALIGACSAHWMSLNAPPDLERWAAIDDPDRRLRVALTEVYRWYEGTEPMVERLLRDRAAVPALDARLGERDAYFEAATAALLTARAERGARRRRARAAIAHALEFETWRSLAGRQGLSRDEAVEMMAALVATA